MTLLTQYGHPTPPNEMFQERNPYQVGDNIVSKDDDNPHQSVTKFRDTLFFSIATKSERHILPRMRREGGRGWMKGERVEGGGGGSNEAWNFLFQHTQRQKVFYSRKQAPLHIFHILYQLMEKGGGWGEGVLYEGKAAITWCH